MIPVFYQFVFDSLASQWVAYALATILVAYVAYSGWRNAPPGAPAMEKLMRTAGYGAAAIAAVFYGLRYVLPPSAALSGKGTGIPIHTYGVLVGLGFMSAVSLSARLAEREWQGAEGLRKRDEIYDLAFWVFLAGFGGSRVLFILVNWKDYASEPGRLLDLNGGLVFYGGLIGAMGVSWFYARKHHFEFLRLADLAIPTVSLGQSFGRLGCFSAGCCWGDVASRHVPWAVHFPGFSAVQNIFGQPSGVPSNAFQAQLEDTRWVVESTGQIYHQAVPGSVRIAQWVAEHGHSLPVHPTQLYESIGQFCLFLGLLFLRKYRRFHGQILAIWLICYALLRSTVELFRGDLERGTLHGLVDSVPAEAWYNISTSQFISLGMLILGGLILWRQGRHLRSKSVTTALEASA